MRVLHVIPSVAPRYGGPSQAVAGLVGAQRAAGLDARIATTDADGPGGVLDVVRGEWTTWRDVPAVFFPRWRGESLKYSPALAAWLTERAAEFDVLHLHAFFSHAVIAGAGAALAAGRPFFVRPLGTLTRYGLSRHPVRKRFFLSLWGRRVLERAAGVHCTSEAERAEVEALGAFGAFVAPLGVTEILGNTARRPVVLFVGRMDPKKNVEALITSFDAVAPAHPEWKLVIAGAGDDAYESRVRAAAAGARARARIEFRGWVDEAEREALLASAGLFALPSRHENFGIAVAEALAAGVPVILSEAVDLALEVREANAGWVAPDESAFTAMLDAAMADSSERARRGEAARRLAATRFTWERCVTRLNDEYARRSGRQAA